MILHIVELDPVEVASTVMGPSWEKKKKKKNLLVSFKNN